MASVESQTPSVKLSLEKYAGTVSVLGQGGDAASLVSDMSTLKEVPPVRYRQFISFLAMIRA